MEQTALRPKPLPGQQPGSGGKFGIGRKFGVGRASGSGHRSGAGGGHRPHAARRRGRRLITLLLGLLFSVALVLVGVGLGTVSATVIGMSKLADMQKAAGAGPKPATPPKPPQKEPSREPSKEGSKEPTKRPEKVPEKAGKAAEGGARPTLGVEAVDAPGGAGALLVGVHSPGPGYTAGLVRGDVLLGFGKHRIGSAKALAAAVAAADPGRNVTLTVRHTNGVRRSLSVTSGFVT